ncbi:MAG: menaquinone biosynthesis family protein [Candidatus Krumholzibacteriia bacterium]
MKTLTIGHSPDADDAFMFYAFAREKVTIDGYKIDHVMEDIESLNHRALRGELDVTAISAAVYPQVAGDYRIMACGASVGRNYGPMLLCKENVCLGDLAGRRIAIPGTHTTAYLLFRLYMTDVFQPVMLPFDAIMPAIVDGEVDAGVIIHEAQLTWKDSGLFRILDLGEAWMQDTGLPIPLGLDCIHRRFDEPMQAKIAAGMEASIVYARENEEDAVDYAMEFGRGIDRNTCRDFIRMYVNDDTVNMREEGKQALELLFTRAAGRGIIDESPPLDIIGLK